MARMRPSLHLVAALAFFAAPAHACLQNVTFVNKTGVACNDLHIIFNRGVTITNTGAFGPDNDEDTQNTHDLEGGSVANDGSTKLDITSSPCNNIQIKEWWWTVGGVLQGVKHQGMPKATLGVSGGPTTGGGLINVKIDAVNHFFNIPPGMQPAQTVLQFKAFLSSIVNGQSQPLTDVILEDATHLVFIGGIVGDPAREMQVQLVSPDGSQQIQIAMSSTMAPGSSNAGLGWLALALGVVGAAVMLRRRSQPLAA